MRSSRASTRASETSQDILDKFWKSIISPAVAPTKASAVLPPNIYAQKVGRQVPRGVTVAEGVEASYLHARESCEKKVAQIVKECTMINQKYSDPYFDLWNRSSCLSPLRANSRPSSPGPPGAPQPPGASFDISQNSNIHGKLVLYDPPVPPPPSGRVPLHPPSVKRVGDIFDKPQFFIEGATAKDIRQGYDGDCWFLSALTTLCNLQPTSHTIDRVCVAQDQDVGVYGFVFYRDGEWISVIVDDKLYLRKADYEDTDEQVRNTWEDNRIRINSAEEYRREFQSNSRALYYAQSTDPNETWVPLIEKAFAKAHGDYGAIEAGAVGEGVEDLTGGISTAILTSDILSKDRFWQDLLKVNSDFLFGCGTADWDDPYNMGRDGIHGGHAYSILAAVDYKSERLVQMKNPWGDSEWNGPWSDGSKEWTAESIKDLDHSFGDDGVFWIRYEDMLRKYEIIWRTRLFSPEWNVTQQWTSLAVPWAGEYQDAKFEVVIAKSAPTVIVLSQLDDRYFRGLTGQYSFKLSFRVHKSGEDEYITRTMGADFEERSVSVELLLEEGSYEVRLRISATRDDEADKVEDVVKDNWLDRREKLLQVGLSYDLAHAKAQLNEIPEKTKEKQVKVKKTKTVTKEKITRTTTTETTVNEEKKKENATEKETKEVKNDDKEVEKVDETAISKSETNDLSTRAPASLTTEKSIISTSQGASPVIRDAPTQNNELSAVPGLALEDVPHEFIDEKASDADARSIRSGASNANGQDDEDPDTPWGAVCVVGLRVYCKNAGATIRIVRTQTTGEKVGLDVDDPSKDATREDKQEGSKEKEDKGVEDLTKAVEAVKVDDGVQEKGEQKSEKEESAGSEEGVIVERSDASK